MIGRIAIFVCITLVAMLPFTCSMRPRGQDSSGRVVLRSVSWAATPTEDQIIARLVDRFNREHPNIHVEHQTIPSGYSTALLTAFAAGRPPDVFWLNGDDSRAFIQRGILLDLSPYIAADKMDVSDFYPATLTPYLVDGHFYGLPNDACATALFYNQDLFDRAGIGYPPPEGWTWDQFAEAAKKLTVDLDGDGRIDQWGFTIPADLHVAFSLVYSNNGELFDHANPDRPRFTEPTAMEVWQDLINLSTTRHVAPLRGEMGDQDARRGFQMGRVAMMLGGWWDMTETDVYAPNLRYAVAPVPRFVRPASQVFSTATSVASSTLHPREAWEFVRFMTGPDGQLLRCKERMAGPSRRSVGNDPYFANRPRDRVFLSAIESGHATYGPHFSIMWDELSQARDRVLQEIQTVPQAYTQAQRNFERRIAR